MKEGNASISLWKRRYIVFMLVAASVVAYIDRQVISILLEAIKHDLDLSDSQIGLLSGLFFSGLYLAAGFPLARLADRTNRRSLIAICLAAWSSATMLCGLAQSYWQLATARSLVAVGEAGATPASSSLIADLFRPFERSRIFALMSCGSAIGIAFGVFAGGALEADLGWRGVFLVLGLPGLVIAVIFRLTVSEPRRPADWSPATQPPLLRAVAQFWKIPSYRVLVFLSIGASTSSYAILAWFPAFLIRVHGLTTAEVGVKLGPAIVVGLLTGNLLCAALTHRLALRDVRWLYYVSGAGLAACVPLGLVMTNVESTNMALAAFTGLMVFIGFWSPPVMTIAVGLVSSNTRGLSAASIPLYMAVGGALGPWLVGVLSDAGAEAFGPDAIRYALMISLVGCLAGAVLSVVGARYLVADYRSEED